MSPSAGQPLRVVQVGVFLDPLARGPEALLEAWPALQATARAAVLAGCDVTVVQAAAADSELVKDGVAYRFVAERAGSAARRRLGRAWTPLTRRVFERVASLEPQLVHFHGLSFPRHVIGLGARLPGVPLLVQDHADQPPPGWRRGSVARALRHATGVAFTAREQAEPWMSSGVLPAALPVVEVLESTTSFMAADAGETSLELARDNARRATGLHGDPCFLWVGRLDPNKDPMTVLEAFSKAASKLPEARLWMCHRDAPLLTSVQARIASDGRLAGTVTLLGSRPHAQVEPLLRAADFLVLGSHREGSGYSVIEALACGATPLVTDIPSLRRITGNGAAGALFRPGDADGLATAMVDWAARDRSALRCAARAHFEARLSVEALVDELRAAYQVVTGRRP